MSKGCYYQLCRPGAYVGFVFVATVFDGIALSIDKLWSLDHTTISEFSRSGSGGFNLVFAGYLVPISMY